MKTISPGIATLALAIATSCGGGGGAAGADAAGADARTTNPSLLWLHGVNGSEIILELVETGPPSPF